MDRQIFGQAAGAEKGKSGQPEADSGQALGRQAFEAFSGQVRQLEAMLGRDSEIGLMIPGAGSSVRIHLRNFALIGQELICFLGVDTEKRNVRLMQNTSQLSVMILEVPKLGDIAFRINAG